MSPGTIVFLVVCVAIIGLVVYLATSQSEIPTRLRRVLKMNIDNKSDDAPARGPRRAARWSNDPDRTNEAAEVERVTGMIRSGEAFTIPTNDPKFWGASGFANAESPATAASSAWICCVTWVSVLASGITTCAVDCAPLSVGIHTEGTKRRSHSTGVLAGAW